MCKVVFFIFSLVCVVILAPITAFAEKSTAVEIYLTKSQLSLVDVQSPTFSHQKWTSEERTLTSKTDLSITIKDSRTGGNSAWALYYRLDAYQEKNSRLSLEQARTHIGQGQLTSADRTVTSDEYQAYPIDMEVTNQTEQCLLNHIKTNESGPITYIYTVNKDDISLQLPKGIRAGSYTAQQIITLRDLPKSN
ncbi:WxL domain-containing protein [Enterococcus sp. LJL128]|uniref:WxL domain-containing protein n=1 Tax=Enterococcus sp. LJL51 TaxID=3416656 RepID=UPI003CEEE89C